METLRIAFVSSHHPEERGMGLAHIVSWLSRCMADWGHATRVYYPIDDLGGTKREAEKGTFGKVETVGVPAPRTSHVPFGPERAFSSRVAKLLRDDLDVVVVNNEQGGANVVRKALKLDRGGGRGAPLAVDVLHGLGVRFLEVGRAVRPHTLRTYHVGYLADRLFLMRLEGRGARACEVCVACSKAVQEDLVRVYGVDPERTHVIYNGVEPQPHRTREDQAKARAELGISGSTKVLTFLGRDPYRKGLDIAQGAVARLRKDGVDVVLLNAGNDVPSTDGVRAFGSVPEVLRSALMDACDAFFLPTRYEGFPAVVQEAAARGIPVITSREANVELGRPGVDFVEVRPNSLSANILAVRQALEDPQLWEMGARGRSTFGTRAYETQAREYLELFHQGLETSD